MVNRAGMLRRANRRHDAADRAQCAAYNMVNPRVIQRERSLCSPNENPDVAREFADCGSTCRAAEAATPNSGSRNTKGMKDKIGGSMWAPF